MLLLVSTVLQNVKDLNLLDMLFIVLHLKVLSEIKISHQSQDDINDLYISMLW
jgi:hypothetical protein